MQYTSNLIFFIVWDQLICSNCFVIDDLLQFVQVSVLIVLIEYLLNAYAFFKDLCWLITCAVLILQNSWMSIIAKLCINNGIHIIALTNY